MNTTMMQDDETGQFQKEDPEVIVNEYLNETFGVELDTVAQAIWVYQDVKDSRLGQWLFM